MSLFHSFAWFHMKTVGMSVLILAGFPLVAGIENSPCFAIGATTFGVEHDDLLTT